MVTCKNLKVTFFKSLLPMYAPAIAESVAQTTKVKLSLSPALLNLVAYTLKRVKSTKVETTTAVAINASLESPALIRNALRNAP